MGFSQSLNYTPLKTNECRLKINGWFRCIPYRNSSFLGDEFVSFPGLESETRSKSIFSRFQTWIPHVQRFIGHLGFFVSEKKKGPSPRQRSLIKLLVLLILGVE